MAIVFNLKMKKNRLLKIVSIMFVVLIFAFVVNHKQNLKIENYKREMLPNFKKLHEINERLRNEGGKNKHIIDKFDLMKNTLPFKNFTTVSSPNGNCEGYSVYEALYYLGGLENHLGSDLHTTYNGELGEIALSQEDIDSIYQGENCSYYPIIERTNEHEIDYDKIINQSLGIEKGYEELEQDVDYSSYTFNNDELKNILDDISNIQINKGYFALNTMPYNPNNINSPRSNKQEYLKYNRGDINIIIDNININKPVVIGMNIPYLGGHALLCYGYEFIDKNNVKIYVKDSNLPLIRGNNLNDEEREYNDSVKNNYILFTKDILINDWSYIYNPKIKGKMIYEGIYNSFVPGMIMRYIFL